MTPSAQAAGGRQRTRWTRETVIAKIIEWEARYGEAPTSADWNPSLARWRGQEWRIERYQDAGWPALNAVKRLFDGSFAAAVRAAGLEPHKPGPRPAAAVAAAALERAVESADGGAARAQRRAAGVERALAEADARVRAALDQADAARHDAESAHAEAAAARGEREVARTLAAEAHAGARAALERARRAEQRARMAERLEAAANEQLAGSAGAAAARATRAAEARALAAERTTAELVELLAGERRALSAAELARLREEGPSGPAVLAASLRHLTQARADGRRGALESALLDLASAALGWRDRL